MATSSLTKHFSGFAPEKGFGEKVNIPVAASDRYREVGFEEA
jgi:hypothetical protein